MKNTQKSVLACALLALSLSQASIADEVIQDDLVVVGSVCIGPECVINEEFGFDTLQLKSANPQINFVDTSASADFPVNDWQMGTFEPKVTQLNGHF
ncbi:MAG: hypothetical protein HRT35_24405 [Algicola sp.]|nr:hypothetical protein [Algicola sp.]